MTASDGLSPRQLQEFYLPPADTFVRVDLPELPYFMLDGEGPPGRAACQQAIRWLFAAVHPIRREARERMGRRFVEPPVECLWWADDVTGCLADARSRLTWRLLMPAPPWATDAMLAEGVAQAGQRPALTPHALRLDRYHEGDSVQIMYEGPHGGQLPTLARLHEEYLPAHRLVPNGPHHEIYLTDPDRSPPERQRTVLRQPVRPG